MIRIRKLDPHLVNQIAAGEVVERPASVVKELIENALDAEASQIDVEVETGGKKLIRIRDNGIGMGPEDLALSVASHATSKLTSTDDLDHISDNCGSGRRTWRRTSNCTRVAPMCR